jgi:NADP-dependent 3-hydroxy acid dehydrogenase YdfG
MAKHGRILTGRVAAVTGGARGIGRVTAKALVEQGMKVGIGDVDVELAKTTAAELGSGVEAFELDVTRRESMRAFLDAVEATLGPLDVMINNAGIMQLGPFLDEDDLTTARQVDINVGGVLFGMKEALPRFRARGAGHLVNIASSAGKAGFAGAATYSGTKHFVVGVSEAVHAELRTTPVEVSCVMPVVVNTELATGLQRARGVKTVVEPEDVAAEIVRALRFPRFDVFVPRSVGRSFAVTGLLPRGVREALSRALRTDQILAGADPDARRVYELRASRSDPGLEPAEDARQLTS